METACSPGSAPSMCHKVQVPTPGHTCSTSSQAHPAVLQHLAPQRTVFHAEVTEPCPAISWAPGDQVPQAGSPLPSVSSCQLQPGPMHSPTMLCPPHRSPWLWVLVAFMENSWALLRILGVTWPCRAGLRSAEAASPHMTASHQAVREPWASGGSTVWAGRQAWREPAPCQPPQVLGCCLRTVGSLGPHPMQPTLPHGLLGPVPPLAGSDHTGACGCRMLRLGQQVTGCEQNAVPWSLGKQTSLVSALSLAPGWLHDQLGIGVHSGLVPSHQHKGPSMHMWTPLALCQHLARLSSPI